MSITRAFCMLLVGVIQLSCLKSFAQESTEIPAEFASELADLLALEDASQFVDDGVQLIQRIKSNLSVTQSAGVLAAIDERASSWLLGQAVVELPIEKLQQLKSWGLKDLTSQQRQELVARISAASPEPNLMTFEQLDEHLKRTARLPDLSYESIHARRRLAATWGRRQEPAALTDEQLDQLIQFVIPKVGPRDGIEVTYQGWIVAPRDGEYRFEISPLRMSASFEGVDHQQHATVKLGDAEVIRATPESWQFKSAAVRMKANEPMSLWGQFQYSHTERALPKPLVAALYWSGPGIGKELVPSAALRTPGQQEAGVTATVRYRHHRAGEPIQYDQKTPNIDYVFNRSTVSENDDLVRSLIHERFGRLNSPEAFEKRAHSAVTEDAEWQMHPLFRKKHHYRELLKYCSSGEREQIAETLASHPESFRYASPELALSVHNSLQAGAYRRALDIYGLWANQNASRLPVCASGASEFYASNRQPYRKATVNFVWEHPECIAWLQEDYLETSEGDCSLPAAYVLAYAHLVQGQIHEWIALLDAKLDDEAIAGDNRVNWLIARAMAEEIKSLPAERHFVGPERLTAGRGWLDEAVLVSQSEAARLRSLLQVIARQMAIRSTELARGRINSELAHFTDPDARSTLTEWSGLIDQSLAAHETQQEAERAAALASYRAELERRRDRAAKRADDVTAQRINQLIGEAEPQSAN